MWSPKKTHTKSTKIIPLELPVKTKVPTYEEAVQMIKAAGGTVVRVEGPHTGSPVAGHITFPHVNYYTATGAKGDLGIFALPAGG